MVTGTAEEFGMCSKRLGRIRPAMEALIEQRKFFGGVILVARHGEVLLHEAVGYRDYENKVPIEKDAVFSIFSMTKSFTGVLTLNAIEAGQFALTTKVSEIIPEFSGGVREDITFYHLLTHTSGLTMTFTPIPGMYIDKLDEVIDAICKKVHSAALPGAEASYAPTVAHALMGEAVRRTDPLRRSFRQIMEETIIKPLGLKDTSVGLRADLRSRHIKPHWLFDKGALQHLGHSDLGPDGAFEEEDAEMPWVGIASTVSDIFRFTEMLRRGGEYDGARILSPVTVERTRIDETPGMINQLYGRNAIARGWEPMPAYLSIGFSLRGEAICHHQFGTFTSPQTFGQHGQGSMLYWVDPKHDVTFVCLSHGVMIEGDNVERFQKLSDMAITSVI
jgi:CubicO group peptidase (beta-lactamase class C family)